jgi:DNA repair protein RadA/Sms
VELGGCGRYYNCERLGHDNEDRSRISLAALSVEEPKRIETGMPELDKVLGGGIVPGAPILLSGDPGAGKTTLLLQAVNYIARGKRSNILWASGEMSRTDIGMFAKRLDALNEHVDVLGNEGDVFKIVAAAEEKKPTVMVIDSINTAFMEDIEADVNTPRQIAAAGNYLTSFAKSEKVAMLIICQVTKEGDLAGPKNLEHLVDAIVYLDEYVHEGDPEYDEEAANLRVLSIGKNRFGPPGIKAMLELTKEGLKTPSKKKSKYLTLV